jgi:hypothetical protein
MRLRLPLLALCVGSPGPTNSAAAALEFTCGADVEKSGAGDVGSGAGAVPAEATIVAGRSPGLVVAVVVLTASSATGDTGPAPTTVWSLGSVSRERATPKKTPMIVAATRPSRRR